MNEERLHSLLSVYRYRGAMPDFRSVVPIRRRRATWPWFAAAAAVIIAILLLVRPHPKGWQVATVIPRSLKVGDIIDKPVRLRSREVGVIDVSGNTTLRLIANNRFELRVGTIHAKTTSPPGVFVVDTPKAVDLGCEYTLSVSPNGSGILRVMSGWVELGDGWKQSLVPQGAMATIGTEGQLSPPIFEDASLQFREAILRHDLKTALPIARRRDALTLLNLLRTAPEEERQVLFDRLSALVPAPPGATPYHLDDWWNDVRKASGVTGLKKKKRMLPPT
jgi:hypothetical protein